MPYNKEFSNSLVLWIDKSTTHRLNIQKLLDDLKIQTIESNTIANALDYLEMKKWVAVFLEWSLLEDIPDEHKKIFFSNRVFKHTPLIFMGSAVEIAPITFNQTDCHIIDVLYKPINPILLTSKLKTFLSLSKQRIELDSLTASLCILNESQRLLLQYADSGVIGINRSGQIIFLNPKACQLIEYTENELLGALLVDYVEHEAITSKLNHWKNKETIASKESILKEESYLITKSYDKKLTIEFSLSPLIKKNKQFNGAVFWFQDITLRKEEEDIWFYKAHYDRLTGIANRTLFESFLEKTLQRSKRLNLLIAVLFVDFDDFKQINDSLGHEQGDRLLVLSVNRLKNCIRSTDLIARLGGDEFAIVLNDILSFENVYAIGKKIINQLTAPFFLAKKWVTINVSVGASVWPYHGKTATALLESSDIAMYKAKRSVGSCLCFSNKVNGLNV